MPEGDTVFRAARTLDKALSGQVLTKTDFRVPKLANADLSGQTVKEVVPRGKHMLTRTDEGMTVRTHFKMEGAWVLYRPKDPWRGPGHAVRLVLETADWTAVGYWLAMVELVPTAQESQIVGHLGPDILGPDWNLEDAVARLRRRPQATIGEALLDQRNVAGIGNLYKNETLFLKGLDPWTKVTDVKDLAGVLMFAQKLMRANTAHAVQATTGNSRAGQEWYVMERPGNPCRRCGTLIKVADQGAPPRLTYWCPHCQRRPRN